MTDGQPEPFRMSTGGDDPDASADEQSGDADNGTSADERPDDLDSPGESIADLIDEASRTAAEQAVQEATGTAPRDRSAEVWGRQADQEDLDDVWSAAAERHSGRHVFDTFLGEDDEAWAQATGRVPSSAAGTGGGTADDEPDVFLFAIDEPDDEDDPGPGDEGGSRGDVDPQPREPAATTADDDQTDAIWGGPSAGDVAHAAIGPDDDGDDDGDDNWGTTIEQGDTEAVWDAAATDEEEPDPFRFAAGAASSAPAEIPDHVVADDEPEPDTFAFAVDATTDDATPATPVASEEQPADEPPEPAPTSSPDAGPDVADDDVWRGSPTGAGDGDVGDGETDFAFDVSDDAGTIDEPALAETATPRSDAGWQDLDDEQVSWSLPDLPRDGGPEGDEEPERFTVSLDAPGGQADDPPDDQPGQPGTDVAPTAASDDLQDALEDLVDDTGAAPPDDAADAAPDPALGRLDDLDDTLSGLDQFDDLGTPLVGGPAAVTPPPVADSAVAGGLDDAAPPTAPPPGAGTPVDDMPPPPADATTGDEHDEDDEDAPPPPAQPPGLTFSSASQPKKRGFFGR